MPPVTVWLRSLVFNVAYLGGSAVLAVVMLPTLMMPRRAMRWLGRVWAAMINGLLEAVVGARVEIRGLDRLAPGACLIAAKHQSTWEVVALLGILPDAAFVLKKELKSIPIFGWYIWRNKQIVIDRRGGAKALKKLLRAARAAAAEGRQIVIFPEGTRLPPGAHRPYQSGVAALYQALALPVAPIALNSGVVWGRWRFIKRPGAVIAEIGAPLPPGLDRATFLARLEAAIEPATRRLEAEARAVAQRSHT